MTGSCKWSLERESDLEVDVFSQDFTVVRVSPGYTAKTKITPSARLTQDMQQKQYQVQGSLKTAQLHFSLRAHIYHELLMLPM